MNKNLSYPNRPTAQHDLYEVLTQLSRDINHSLGDRTGRTVTMRTGDGIHNWSNGRFDPSGEETHLLMGLSAALLLSGNRMGQVVGGLGVLALAIAWHAGKEEPAKLRWEETSARNERRVRMQRVALPKQFNK